MTTDFEAKLRVFLDEVNDKNAEYHNTNYPHSYTTGSYELRPYGGTKYLKLATDNGNRVWGFVSLVDGTLKGAPVKVGDLLKAAGWRAPAKHSRGNILDGTAQYGPYGPSYL